MHYRDYVHTKILPTEFSRFGFEYYDPANSSDIAACVKEVGMELPEQLIDFYKLSNGAVLFNLDNIDGYKILDTRSLAHENRLAASIYEESWNQRILLFAKIIGEGNWLGLTQTPSGWKVVDCFHELDPSDWQVLPSDFGSFLDNLFLHMGDKFWLKPSQDSPIA